MPSSLPHRTADSRRGRAAVDPALGAGSGALAGHERGDRLRLDPAARSVGAQLVALAVDGDDRGAVQQPVEPPRSSEPHREQTRCQRHRSGRKEFERPFPGREEAVARPALEAGGALD